MEIWVKERLATFLPALEAVKAVDGETQIASLCESVIQALRDRGIAILSFKRPLRELRNAVKELETPNALIALKYLELTEDEKRLINQPSERKRDERLTHQSFIRRPNEVVFRISQLLESDQWAEIAAGLSAATGRRLAEVVRFASFREKSLYSVWFTGQRKTNHADEYEIPTLVPAREVLSAWRRLRELRDFSEVPSDSISSSYGPAVKEAIVRAFSDLIEAPLGRAELYTHVQRAVYPRLAIYYFLPSRVEAIAYANVILGHVANKDGELVSNYQSTLYYMSYKILADDGDGSIDGREGLKLSLPGVEVLEKFKTEEEKLAMMAETTIDAGRTKVSLNRTVKAVFDEQQEQMGCATANDTMVKLLEHNSVYRQLEALVGDVSALVSILSNAADIKLEHETALEALHAAIADKRRFRATYEKRTVANEEKDYSSMPIDELAKIRTTQASVEKWRRAVSMIMEYNENAAIPELRWYINSSAVKALVGGRGTDIGKYLKSRQEELDAHHKRFNLRPGVNHGRTNVRERVLGENAAPIEEDEEE